MANTKKKVNVLEDLRKMDAPTLATKLADLRRELVEQHRANKAGELPSAAVITKTRRSIAKAMTVLGELSKAAPAQKEQEK